MSSGFRPSLPGERRGGRQKGTPNKSTALLKDAILLAAQKAGGDTETGLVDYLTTQASENPGPFMSLLGKVLPMQIAGDPDAPISISVSWLTPE
jgi:hypothetical protein